MASMVLFRRMFINIKINAGFHYEKLILEKPHIPHKTVINEGNMPYINPDKLPDSVHKI